MTPHDADITGTRQATGPILARETSFLQAGICLFDAVLVSC
jgi:hypothetical protein